MVPTLKDGDLLLVRLTRRAEPGQVVLARFRSMPDRLVLKRVVRYDEDGAELVSDNPFAGGDSATHGLADVYGRVRLRHRAGSLGLHRVR